MKQTAETDAPNILLITVDCLRYDHLGCYGYHRDTSPNIDALATRGVKFLQAISNGGQTPQSFPSILASALPPLQQSWGKPSLRANVMLAELLKHAGYHTAAFHSNPWLSRFYGYDRGFDTFEDTLRGISLRGIRVRLRQWKSPDTLVGRIRCKAGEILAPVIHRVAGKSIVTAGETTAKATSWLEVNQGKYFLWLHYMDVHPPYLPPSKYLRYFSSQPVSRQEMHTLTYKMMVSPGQLSPSEVQTIICLYDAELRYADEAIGVLLGKVKNYSSNTFIIVTADHGDEFGEHGSFGHHSVYDGILRVPLIIAGPGIAGGTSVEQQVSLIDLAPTILDIAGLGSPPSFRGKSLLPLIKGEEGNSVGTISTIINPRFGETSIAYRVPGWKYIHTASLDGSGAAREEVYDLIADPGETRNLHGTDTEEARKLELEAEDKLAQFRQLKLKESTDYEKQRIRAKISNLGKL